VTTADVVRETALNLARAETPEDEAIRELLECCSERRVPVVLARQQFEKELEGEPVDPLVKRAAELLDGVLGRLPLG
jgi:hypothetical protein